MLRSSGCCLSRLSLRVILGFPFPLLRSSVGRPIQCAVLVKPVHHRPIGHIRGPGESSPFLGGEFNQRLTDGLCHSVFVFSHDIREFTVLLGNLRRY